MPRPRDFGPVPSGLCRGVFLSRLDRTYRLAILGAMLTAPLIVSAGVVETAEQKDDRPSLALRILVPGKPNEKPGLTPMIRAALESVGSSVDPVAPSRWADLTPDDADFILLSQTAVPHLERATAEEIAALEHAVARGIHLIVVGAAATALPHSRTYARMIGRSPNSGAWTAERTTPSEVGVFVGRQDHPITQCVPHLVFGRAVITAVLDGDQILARAVRTVDATDPEFSRGQNAGQPRNAFGVYHQP